jgi:transposase
MYQANNLPNRLAGQRQMFAEHGIDLATSTLSNWIRQLSDLLEPVAATIEDEVLGHDFVQFDETRIRVRDPTRKNKKKIRAGHLWVFCRASGSVRCLSSPTKSGETPKRFLKDYQGYVQADAASTFDAIYEDGQRLEVGCWAHSRRRFEGPAKEGIESAQYALLAIARLYNIDKEAKELGQDELLKARREQSTPILEGLFDWFGQLRKILSKSDACYEGVSYALNHEEALRRFVEYAPLNLDKTRSERNMKRIGIGRRNWLFTGSAAGAKRTAVLYSLVLSCQELGLPIWEYLNFVLKTLPSTRKNKVKDLRPRQWSLKQSN